MAFNAVGEGTVEEIASEILMKNCQSCYLIQSALLNTYYEILKNNI